MNIPAILAFFHVLWAVPLILVSYTRSPSSASRFKVHSLPDAPSLPRSWAGRIPVPDAEDGNEMFFWFFEAEDPIYDGNFISQCIWREWPALDSY